MRAEIYRATDSGKALAGVVDLDRKGRVRFGRGTAFVKEVGIAQPDTGKRLTPEDGEEYLKALPYEFRSPYLWAELIDE